jgi:chaperonin cofactor prefoldin
MVCLAFCISGLCGSPAVAEPDSDPVVLELERVRASLERLVELLEDAQAGQRAELILRRIERKERRLLPLESRMQDVREELSLLEQETAEFEGFREQFDQELRDARERGESDDREARMIREQIDRREEELEKRKESLELRIRRLEDEVAERREEIALLEASLEEKLADLPDSD